MDPISIGLIGSLIALILLFLGMPIGLALMLVGFLGISFLSSLSSALPVIARTFYDTSAYYPYTVIPLFVLMGSFASASGLVERLYTTCDKFLQKVPGGVAITTIAVCAGFAAISGSSVATAAAMSNISYPEMMKLKYSKRLALGTIAAGGTLGFLIPPSIGFVIYGILTEQSIGKLLIAGILPGILLTLAFIGCVIIQIKYRPNIVKIRISETISLREKLFSLINLWELILIFLTIVGGIYLGWFTPTEAAAISASILFISALFRRKLSINNLFISLRETTKITAMVIVLVIGATTFSIFLGLSTIPVQLASWVAGLAVSRYVVLLLIILIYLILGCFIDSTSMMVLTLPVVFPLILELGFNPIFFGVICVLMMEAGLITPPMGLNLYTIAGSIKDVSMDDIYQGAIPFLIPILVIVFILILYPEICLYLPAKMFGGGL